MRLVLAIVMLLATAPGAAQEIKLDQTPHVVRLLAIGDSLTAGLGLPLDQSFPAQLETKLKERGFAVEVTNAGVSGDTTAGVLARLDWALAEKPDAVIIAIGANDALRALPPETTGEL